MIVRREGGLWPGEDQIKLEYSSSHKSGEYLISYHVVRVKINETLRAFKTLKEWYLELDLSQMISELEIFDDRVVKDEPRWDISSSRQTSFLKFTPDPAKMPSTDAGIFTFEIKTKTKGPILLTSAFFCGFY